MTSMQLGRLAAEHRKSELIPVLVLVIVDFAKSLEARVLELQDFGSQRLRTSSAATYSQCPPRETSVPRSQ